MTNEYLNSMLLLLNCSERYLATPPPTHIWRGEFGLPRQLRLWFARFGHETKNKISQNWPEMA